MTTTVGELRRAWAAIGSGQFADLDIPETMRAAWRPATGERVIAVVGAQGTVGASTLALAIATVAAPARVIECAPTGRSGLVGAATAELGRTGSWVCGSRDQVLLQRWDGAPSDELPMPLAGGAGTTVVDAGSNLDGMTEDSWLAAAICSLGHAVVVGDRSVPGIRRLQQTLATLGDPGGGAVCVVTVGGPNPRRCSRLIRLALDDLDPAFPLVHVPDDRRLRIRGLDTSPLPRPLLAAAQQILMIADQARQMESS